MNYLLVPAWLFEALQYTSLALGLGAGALLALGLAGARRGWEPRCRRCTHDLRAVDPSTGACPECGADLARPGAVRAGRRRVRSVVVSTGALLLALAGLAAWKLDAAGVRALRGALVASMPTQPLVEALFEGGELQPTIRAELHRRAGSQGAHRTLASGELLDALLRATDRCEEAGRKPLAAALQSDAFILLAELDDAERTRLIELAVEELIATGGARMTRYQLALCTQRASTDGTDVAASVLDRLGATPEGRRILGMRMNVTGPLVSGAVERIALVDTLPLPPSRRNTDSDESVFGFVFGEAALESLDGAVRRPLVRVAKDGFERMRREDPCCDLLIDAPPGKYRLTMKGVLAKSVLLPRGGGPFEAEPTLSIDDALALEGARPFEGTSEVEIGPPVASGRVFTDAPSAVERVAGQLANCRIKVLGGDAWLDLDSLTERGRGARRSGGQAKAEPAPGMALLFSAAQAGRTWRLGALTMWGGGYSSGIGSLPDELELTEPFKLIAEPQTAWNQSGERVRLTSGGRSGGATPAATFVWATFTLRFDDASKEPQVEVTGPPLAPATGTARSDDAARNAIAGWVATLGGDAGTSESAAMGAGAIDGRSTGTKSTGLKSTGSRVLGKRSRRDGEPPVARTLDLLGAVNLAAQADGSISAETGVAWPTDLVLSGWVELRNGDRLAAPVQPVFGALGRGGMPAALTPVFAVPDDAPLTVRYTPDAGVGAADGSGPFGYLGAGFEVRFASATSKAELAWLDGTASRAEEGRTP